MQPINKIAEKLSLADDDLEFYGRYTAKVRLNRLPGAGDSPKGKLILVTAITPTSHGEGKTVVSIGLAQALEKLGKKSIVTLREPSLGPVFGVKGGASGGGRSQVLPGEKINLHFNGDIHAVAAAHNLLAAMIDSHLHHGNDLKIDVDNIFWPRTLDMNDRALRHVIVGLGGKASGVPRETGFVITAASEVMAALALAGSRADLGRRLSEITVGFNLDGRIVRAGDLGATGAMMVLLNEAIMPNLVQTTEETPALIHAGPFANIAHGTSSVIAQRMALGLADYAVNETGFGADLGAEKFLDIVMPASGLKPSTAVLIATVRGVRAQAGSEAKGAEALKGGLANLAKHVENLRKFGLPVIVAINRFPDDSEAEIRCVRDFSAGLGAPCAAAEVFDKGSAGGLELAARVIEATERTKLEEIKPLYPAGLGIKEKIDLVAREIYGAASVYFESGARRKLEKFSALGFSSLPVCMAKTQSSLSDDPKRLGAPKNWTLTVTDAHLASGAGFIVAVAGNMMLMPGLSKTPQAARMGVDSNGKITGLS
ncbi:MAG: formate--tetrahydrofolate ligase [Deltaproteobacteria bacterium]|nr:formate--tetrahydrofolate ligase [Deltaproteobacteria bacterium]